LRAKNFNPKTHTRLPRYVRGRLGTVAACLGAFEFADSLAHGKDNNRQHVYRVRFESSELWGPEAGPKDAVYLDLYESYVEVA
jgi:nitrile hydratase